MKGVDQFETLLKKLVESIEFKTKAKVTQQARKKLAEDISWAAVQYAFTQPASKVTKKLKKDKLLEQRTQLHRLKEPLQEVMLILEHEGNRASIFEALERRVGDRDRQSENKVSKRYEYLLLDLDRIYRAIPPPPPKPGRGNSPKTKDLYALVAMLADCWNEVTEKELKRSENKLSGAQFVRDAVEYIDRTRMRSVKKVIDKVINERKKSRRPRFPLIRATSAN
jgi:hypothetical protein